MSVSREEGLIVFIHRELSEGVSLIEILMDIKSRNRLSNDLTVSR